VENFGPNAAPAMLLRPHPLHDLQHGHNAAGLWTRAARESPVPYVRSGLPLI